MVTLTSSYTQSVLPPPPKENDVRQYIKRLRQRDSELDIQQSLMDYKRLGYSDNWINQRLKSIEIRKDLTDQWKAHNVKEGVGYATLTDIIYQAWAGLTAREYKPSKDCTKKTYATTCRRGMKASVATTAGLSAQRSLSKAVEELVMNMLAELTATNITKEEHPQTMHEHAKVAARGDTPVARLKYLPKHR